MSYVQIRTERGSVRVIASECKYRPCLHIHWSSHGRDEKINQRSGARIVAFPLVCMRNEQYGCPHPLPEPEKP